MLLPPLVVVAAVGPLNSAEVGSSAAQVGSPGQLRSEVRGEVLEILVAPGQSVVSGQALVRVNPIDARLSDSSARIQIEAARAQLQSAEADFKRYTGLRDQSFISAAEWERRQAALAAVRADFEATVDRLGLFSIRAPRSAAIASIHAQPGQILEAGQLVVSLRGGGTSPPALSPKVAAGPRIPTRAILDGRWVFRVVGPPGQERVERVAVAISDADEYTARLLHGLAPGDRVVAVGVSLLADGQRVRVKP